MTRRIVAITVAIVLAALGAAGGLFLIATADKRAQDRLEDAVTVAIANDRITVNTSGAVIQNRSLIRLQRMPKANVPPDAVTDFGPAYNKLVLTSTVAKDQLLLRGNFGVPSEGTTGLAIPDGKMAITVQTSAPAQVAGYVGVGSHVTIFLTYTVAGGTSGATQRTRTLLPSVEVLAIGVANGKGDTTNPSTNRSGPVMLTVAVSPADAERLIEALNHGSLYLGLANDSSDVKAGPGVDNRDTGDSSNPLFR